MKAGGRSAESERRKSRRRRSRCACRTPVDTRAAGRAEPSAPGRSRQYATRRRRRRASEPKADWQGRTRRNGSADAREELDRNHSAARAGRRREAILADAAEDRSVEDEFEPDRHFRRREDRRRSVRRTRNRAADVRRGRRCDRIPARIVARKSARRTPDRRDAGQDRAAHAARRLAEAARKVADARPCAAARDDDRGRERRGQDHEHRQAGQASCSASTSPCCWPPATPSAPPPANN